MINILHNISWMELSARFKDLCCCKKKIKGLEGGKAVDREAKYLPSKRLILALSVVLKFTLAAFKHCCEGLLCMGCINFHSKLILLSFE